ncbi:MAG: hypothetical protein LBF95_01240, partial [Treponema sp.]|nr:hypothetical protein [Treponema sp.]
LLLFAGAFFLIVVSGHDGGYRGYKGRLNKQRKLIWGAAGRCRTAAPQRVAVGGNQQIVIPK